jgi:hypothetical protein
MKQLIKALALAGFGLASGGCGGDDGGPTSTGDIIRPHPVQDLTAIAGAASTVTLAFTASGDDGDVGQAALYEMRYARYPADPERWNTWQRLQPAQAPRSGGSPDTVTVGNLVADAAYAFRLRCADEAGNWSEPSNVAIASACEQLDTTAPAPVTDLQLWSSTNSSLTVAWTSPGDDGPYGTVSAYDVRWAEFPLDEQNWSQATPVTDLEPAVPQPAGRRHFATVAGLAADSEYYLAVRSADEIPNRSGMSNVLSAVARRFRTWYVKEDGGGDAPTIQAACVDSAQPGDVVLVAPGHYTWTNQGEAQPAGYGMIVFWRNEGGFTLTSEAGPEATIIDAERRGRAIFIQGIPTGGVEDAVIDGFTITGGYSLASAQGDSGKTGGGMVVHLCSPTIRNCIFRDNEAVYGGGFAQAGAGSPRLESCTFESNTADYGAAIGLWTAPSYPEIVDCAIRHNEARVVGAGIYAGRVDVRIEGCLIHHNTAADKGGGIYLAEVPSALITRCTIAKNTAGTGGGIRVASGSYVTVENAIIAFQYAGGAIQTIGDNTLQVGCCDAFGNVGGDAWPAGFTDLGGNFSFDPLFCDGNGDGYYNLQASSPCAPGMHPAGANCGSIGSGGIGCTSVR